jgi:hypothetical protein
MRFLVITAHADAVGAARERGLDAVATVYSRLL